MRILLVSANTSIDPYPVYPLGLDYVAGAIGDRHEVRIMDVNTLSSMADLSGQVRGFDPGLIGVSIRNVDNTEAQDPKGFMDGYRKMIGELKAASGAPIVLGGSGFTIFPSQMMGALGADYGIVGEGERLVRLVDALEKGEDPRLLTGVMVASEGVDVPRPLTRSFHRRFDPETAHLGFYLNKGGMLNLQTHRGCCFRCIYCTYPHIEGRRLRLIDPEEVADTAMALQRAGAAYLFITDSAFNADIDHSLSVAEHFRKSGLSIPWGAFFIPNRMPDRYFERLRSAGLTHVEFGTESFCNPVLEAYGKPFRRQEALDAHRSALASRLHVAHYLLLGGPGETQETLDDTLETAQGLRNCVLFFFCGMRIYPNTALYDRALKEGQVTVDQDLLSPVFYRSPFVDSRAIHRQLEAAGKDRPNWVIGSGGQETARTLLRLYEKGYKGPLWEMLRC